MPQKERFERPTDKRLQPDDPITKFAQAEEAKKKQKMKEEAQSYYL